MTTLLRRDFFRKRSMILRKELNDFDPKFKYVVNRLSKVNKEEAKHILARHRLNNQPQKCILHYKENRSVKCYGRRCDVVFTKGSLCYSCFNDSIGQERGCRTTILFLWEKIAYCRSQSGVTFGTQRVLKHVKPL